MAISYQILKDKRLVIVTTSGETNLSETIQSLEQMFADPEYSMDWRAENPALEYPMCLDNPPNHSIDKTEI